ncbi:MAG: glycoside hydrolase family 15 protein [Rhodospirillaceae bacterium]|nr:MAG: glycoside hydrolase family 15 protein [Rhodospirillaceae bacterium]
MRLTTDAPLTYLLQETWFKLERPIALFFGPDETLAQSVMELVTEFHQKTVAYWRNWVRSLSLPVDWQDAVIRAAITLKLCWFEETGGIIAAMTTSIPEAPNSGRNWDYRYCWLRDAYYVIQALNRLGVVDILESYFGFLRNLPPLPDGKVMQPVYGLGLEQDLTEWTVATLNGYRNMGPVRIGNQAFEHRQHDIYGQVILSMARAFFDRRLLRPMTMADFEQLEILGRKAFDLAQVPDAGIWEMRTISRVNTYSSLMCWAACDRLGRIASHFGENTRANMWQERAMSLQKQLLENAWNPKLNHFTSTFHGKELDGSLLQMAELGIVEIDDPRFTATVTAIERDLRRGHHVFRYIEADDIGVPTTAFTACTFWLIDILNRQGERARARDMFQHVLDARNHVGLLSEDIDPHTSELWGNFPQTYSLVGIINTAMRLSRHWRDVA